MIPRDKLPFLWFTQPINGVPKPWEHVKIEGVTVNAYEILRKRSALGKIVKLGIHRYLNFNGLIMMDSGGFQFMKFNKMEANVSEIVELYLKANPDVCVALDFPLSPGLSRAEIRRRLQTTLKNTRIMIETLGKLSRNFLPVIHGHDLKTIEWFIGELFKISDFRAVGIGSLVPSVFTSKGAGSIYNLSLIHI